MLMTWFMITCGWLVHCCDCWYIAAVAPASKNGSNIVDGLAYALPRFAPEKLIKPPGQNTPMALKIILMRQAELFQIIRALRLSGRLAGGLDRGQEESDQYTDDCYDNQQLDERKASLPLTVHNRGPPEIRDNSDRVRRRCLTRGSWR